MKTLTPSLSQAIHPLCNRLLALDLALTKVSRLLVPRPKNTQVIEGLVTNMLLNQKIFLNLISCWKVREI